MNHQRPAGVVNDKRPVWREPTMWLVVALPLGSIIASVSLLVIALRSGGADVVADPVQRTAQIQVADLGPDARAQQLQLGAIVRIDQDFIEVLPVSGEFRRDAPLRIALRHPTRAGSDRELVLQPGELGWRGAADIDGAHDWVVQLSPPGGSWRLQGRLPRGQRAAHLKPSLSGP